MFPGGLTRARELLRTHFGHPVLRVHQIRVLGALFAGRSVLAVLPTGAGKSLCYQVPALMADELTLVISPLVALMQDQVAALQRRGLPAAYVNSLLTPDERRAVIAAACAGEVRLLYCAPERLASLAPRLRAAGVRVAFLAVDEAHCIVEWGNEFRPVYQQLGKYRYLLGNPVTLAVTGSATPDTRAEIVRVLRVPDADVITTSFDRPNLVFLVQRVRDDRERFAEVRRLVRHAAGHTVLYTPTRRLTELVARALLRAGIAAAPYHAGLLPGDPPPAARRFPQRPCAGGGRHQRVRDGDRQARRAAGHPLGPAVHPRGLLPRGRAGRARWRASYVHHSVAFRGLRVGRS